MEVIALYREVYEPEPEALLAALKRRASRSEGTPATMRSVTWTGWCRESAGRRSCDTPGLAAVRRTAAPVRLPPQVRNSSASWRARAIEHELAQKIFGRVCLHHGLGWRLATSEHPVPILHGRSCNHNHYDARLAALTSSLAKIQNWTPA
jgi:hypothetical protein